MKTTTALIAAFLLPSLASASAPFLLTTNEAETKITIVLDSRNELGKRLIDVIQKSPNVKEVKNGWVKPGDLFEGENLFLAIDQERGIAGLNLVVPKGDAAVVDLKGNLLRITGARGAVIALHRTLIESRSPFALTAERNQGQVVVRKGQVVVLEKDSFVGNSVNCQGLDANPGRAFCEFNFTK